MTTFDKREEAFEKKFALDEEQKFKAEARRNRLLGMWAAGKLGISGDAASAYAKEIVAAEFSEGGDDAVVRKVMGDLAAKGIAVTESQIRDQMTELMPGHRPGEGRDIEPHHGRHSGACEARTRISRIPGLRSLRRIPERQSNTHPSLKPYSGTLPLAP